MSPRKKNEKKNYCCTHYSSVGIRHTILLLYYIHENIVFFVILTWELISFTTFVWLLTIWLRLDHIWVLLEELPRQLLLRYASSICGGGSSRKLLKWNDCELCGHLKGPIALFIRFRKFKNQYVFWWRRLEFQLAFDTMYLFICRVPAKTKWKKKRKNTVSSWCSTLHYCDYYYQLYSWYQKTSTEMYGHNARAQIRLSPRVLSPWGNAVVVAR